ncbi:factor-independent urate hydroxylase [Nocardia huaxiensis]|uniref:Uricase n=1 Tax=Nocardia huaxiensis TaxID=2755382 RepID=A0A7D6Z3I0_9NOCA|nr:urate oxidase [Nocardia huaxiensis]QLY30124.1 urate oxidase [Nocardia huaxiensis]UFS96265.1 urate oxidase [Nocardia huaxiensis]
MTESTGKIVLGPHQYGKAENRVVRIYRDTDRHEIRDLNVSTCLRGAFDDAHTIGDQHAVLPTDTQKQTAYAYAKTHGDGSIEDYGLALARHFVDDIEPVDSARVEIEEYAWQRVPVAGVGHAHTWTRTGPEVRTAAITVQGTGPARREWVIGGVKDLVILKSTGSEFAGFLTDDFTVLEPAHDRVLATSLVARWRFTAAPGDWNATYDSIRATLAETFATLHSKALQQTLYEMARAALESHPVLAEIRLSAPNKHHFAYDLTRFGIANNNEVFHAADRPYGLIQASALREDAPDPGIAWDPYTGAV